MGGAPSPTLPRLAGEGAPNSVSREAGESLGRRAIPGLTPLADTIALVTGASRGIGAATAVELARLGAHVVITARTQGGLEETDDAIRAVGGSATLLPLDLAEGGQVDAIGPSLYQRFGRLDVLVHNAGALGRLTPVAHILPNDWADVLAVNLSAAWHLIRTCDPLLRNAAAGRAVFVTDARARAPKAYWGAYGATKAGMEHLVLTWAEEVRTTRLRVNLFDPGVGGHAPARRTRCRARTPPRWRSRMMSRRRSPRCACRASNGTAWRCVLCHDAWGIPDHRRRRLRGTQCRRASTSRGPRGGGARPHCGARTRAP